jgi:hypothetical protein
MDARVKPAHDAEDVAWRCQLCWSQKKGPLARPGVHQVEDSCRRQSQEREDGDQMPTPISETDTGADHK